VGIMLLGMVRAMAPLDVPFIRHLTIVLAVWLIVVALLRTDGGIAVVWLNQLVVGGLVALSAAVALVVSVRRR
jgi:hypothetical protein